MNNLVRGCGPCLLVALAATAFLDACGGGGGGGQEPAAVIVTPAPIPAAQNLRYQMVLADTASGQQITDPLSLTFVGAPQVKAFNGTVLNGTTVTATSGQYAFDTAFTATATDLSVQIADPGGKGWVPTGINLSAPPGATGDQTVVVKMVNTKQAAAITASAAPVAMTVKTVTAAADGSLTAPLSVATTPKTFTNAAGVTQTMGVAKVELATGTKVTTQDGAPAAPGPLTVSSTYYSPVSSESLSAFPGGFAPTVRVGTNTAVLNGAATDSAAFVTAGFAQFNVTDSAGKPIKNFDPAVTLGIDLPKATRDVNRNAVTVGSDFPVWSYDETSGQWVFEKIGKVSEKTPVDPDNYNVVFQTSHLSSWSLGQVDKSCNGTINLVGRGPGDERQLQIDIVGVGGGFNRTGYVTDSTLDLTQVSASATANIAVSYLGQQVGAAANQSLCGTVTITLANLPPLPSGTVEVRTSEICDVPGAVARAAPTAVNLRLPGSAAPISDATQSGTTPYAAAVFAGVPPGAGASVSATNTRTGSVETQTVAVGATGTTVVPFTFHMTCPTATGAGGS